MRAAAGARVQNFDVFLACGCDASLSFGPNDVTAFDADFFSTRVFFCLIGAM